VAYCFPFRSYDGLVSQCSRLRIKCYAHEVGT
jgi:hypothetical protein